MLSFIKSNKDTIIVVVNFSLFFVIYILTRVLPNCFTNIGIFLNIVGVVFIYLLRQYIRGAQCKLTDQADDKVVLITGANSGIGFALMKLLYKRGASIHMLCRNRKKGEEAINRLKKLGMNTEKISLHVTDLSNLRSVYKFIGGFLRDITQLDILVCNAGLLGQMKYTETVDGHELTYQTNFLAHHLIIQKLLPIIPKTGKIINISSMMHLYGDSIEYSIMNSSSNYCSSGLMAYNRTKLAQVMSAKEMATELPDGPTFVSCHPGNVHSNILQTGVLAFLEQTWVKLLISFVLKSEDDGAQTPLYACLAKDLVSGAYYRECRLDENVNPLVNNIAERRKLLCQTRKVLTPFLR